MDHHTISAESQLAIFPPLYVGIFLDRPEFTKLIELYKKALPENRTLLPCCADGHVTLHYGTPTPHISQLLDRLSGTWVKLQLTGIVDLWHIQAAIVYVVHPELNRLNAGAEHHVTIATKEGQSPAAAGEFLNKKCGEPLPNEYPVKFDGRAVWGWVGIFYGGGKGRVPAGPSEPNCHVIRSLRSIALDSKPNCGLESAVLEPIIPRKHRNRSGSLLSPKPARPNHYAQWHLTPPTLKRPFNFYRELEGRSQRTVDSKFKQRPYEEAETLDNIGSTQQMISPLSKLPSPQAETTRTPMSYCISNFHVKQGGISQLSRTTRSQSPSTSNDKQGDIPQPNEGLCVSPHKLSGTEESKTVTDGGKIPSETESTNNNTQTNPPESNLMKANSPKKIVDLPRRTRPSRRKRVPKKASSLPPGSESSRVAEKLNS